MYFPAYRCRLQQTSENGHRGGQGGLLEGGVPLADVWLCILRSESTRDGGADLTHFFAFIQSSRRRLFFPNRRFSHLSSFIFFSANVRTRFPRHCFDRYQQARPHHQPPQDEGEEVVFNKSISSSTLITFTFPSFYYFFFFFFHVGGFGNSSIQPYRKLVQWKHLFSHDYWQFGEGEEISV